MLLPGLRPAAISPDLIFEKIERAGGSNYPVCRYIRVEGGRLDASVAEQGLDGSDVRTVFQKMSGEAVPQRMHSDVFLQSGPFGSPAAREVNHPSR